MSVARSETQDQAKQGSHDDGPNGSMLYPSVAVVVPTYNEAENLPELAGRLFSLGIPNARLIVVDDGSPDGTGDVARKLAQEHDGRIELIERAGKQGLGTAYLAGFERALSEGVDCVLQMDGDLSHELKYVPEFLDGLRNADVVVGSRYVAGGGVDETWSLFRRFLSYSGNLGIRLVTGLEVKDSTSGFKAFRSSALEGLDMTRFKCKGFAFQVEMAYACQRMGYEVLEYPIVFASRARGRSKMSIGIVIEALWRIVPLRWSRGR